MSFIDSFKNSMMEIVNEAKTNPEHAEELLDTLFAWIDEEIQTRVNYQEIHISINDINNHLSVVGRKHIDDATVFYSSLNENLMRNNLINFYAKYLQSRSNGNFPQSCKFLFQQIETLVNFLLYKKNLFLVAARDVKMISDYKLKRDKKNRLIIPLFLKIKLISDHFRSEFGRMSTPYKTLNNFTYEIKETYDPCYLLRNYDSHGMSFSDEDADEVDLIEFEANAVHYLSGPIRLIIFLRDIAAQVQ